MISFPRLECWNNATNMATLVAEVDKKRVLCRVSLTSLRDKFGDLEEAEDLMPLVAKHRITIQEAARNLIERERYEEDGSILVKTQDL
jgi:hypothetical protein